MPETMTNTVSSTVFDADTLTSPPPELKIGGRVFVGRVLSIVEWFTFKERFDAIEAAPKSEQGGYTPAALDASAKLAGEFLRAIFPNTDDGADPIAELERRGIAAVTQAFSAFFGHCLHALGMARLQATTPESAMSAPTTSADGTSSQSSTPVARDAAGSNSPTS